MYFIYILQSLKNNSYYIGCTKNIKKRLYEHNKGLGKYTRDKGPWMLKYNEKYLTLSAARQREKEIKSWKSRKRIEHLITKKLL